MSTIRPVDILFPVQAAAKEAGLCPLCREIINPIEFRTSLDVKEFEISGLCQACQDDIFW